MQRYRDSVENFDFHFTAWHNDVWKPVITAVNGICAGGGFHWIADSDIVIAASDAQFFDPHTSIGQVVSIEAIGLMKRMPVEAVMRMAFVGRYERMSAQRAYELGRARLARIGETEFERTPQRALGGGHRRR
ncbi:MAG: enoyl-CoA hydratase/isomerase family protein [Acidimicrobiales bacterium]